MVKRTKLVKLPLGRASLNSSAVLGSSHIVPGKKFVPKSKLKRVPIALEKSKIETVLGVLGFIRNPGKYDVYFSSERRTTVQIPPGGKVIVIKDNPTLRGLVGEYIRTGGKL